MGCYQHDYIFATTCTQDIDNKFLDFLKIIPIEHHKLFMCHKAPYNGFYTLMMFPDGASKWNNASYAYNHSRQEFIAWLKNNNIHYIYYSEGELGLKIERQ